MRQPGNKKPKEKGTFISAGPNWVMSLENMTNLWVFKITHFQSPFMVLPILQAESYPAVMEEIYETNSSFHVK